MTSNNNTALVITAASVAAVAVASAAYVCVIRDALLRRRARGKKAAVVLAGVGYLDGSETIESVSCLVNLSHYGISFQVFAPETPQFDVVDHQSQSVKGYAPRMCDQEAARISRGNVLPLSALSARDYDYLVVPGGFGVAKTLSNWAVCKDPKAEFKLNTEVGRVLAEFAKEKKRIGLCCISPVLALLTFTGEEGCRITLGKDDPSRFPYAGTIAAVKQCFPRVTVVPCEPEETCVDAKNMLVTTPAFMCDAGKTPHLVFKGIRGMVRDMIRL